MTLIIQIFYFFLKKYLGRGLKGRKEAKENVELNKNPYILMNQYKNFTDCFPLFFL